MIPPLAVGSTIIDSPPQFKSASDAETEAAVEAHLKRRRQALQEAIEMAEWAYFEFYDEPSTCACCGGTAWCDRITVDWRGFVVRFDDSLYVDVADSKRDSDATEQHYACVDCFGGRTIRRGQASTGVSLWLEATSERRRRR